MTHPRKSSSKTSLRVAAALGALCALLPSIRGQKAEPNFIEFPNGSNSAMVSGTLRTGAQAEYVMPATAGRSFTLQLQGGPRNAFTLKLRSPEHKDLPLTASGPNRWRATPEFTGNYQIWVVRNTNVPSLVNYKLRVTLH